MFLWEHVRFVDILKVLAALFQVFVIRTASTIITTSSASTSTSTTTVTITTTTATNRPSGYGWRSRSNLAINVVI